MLNIKVIKKPLISQNLSEVIAIRKFENAQNSASFCHQESE